MNYQSQNMGGSGLAPKQAETFLLSQEAQDNLPEAARAALEHVDRREDPSFTLSQLSPSLFPPHPLEPSPSETSSQLMQTVILTTWYNVVKYFLISAPVDWQPDQYIRRYMLPTGEYVSCVLWNNLFHITGTDIVRCLSFRFQAFGRPVKNSKKFEEGIFSDLRNLKAGQDAALEEPKSQFLDFLYKNNCIRTQKKQKVFYWFSVPHDRLFLDALERDLKREKMHQEATTEAVSEPALTFEWDPSQTLWEQMTKAQQTNSSSYGAQQPFAFSQPPAQSMSPIMRPVDMMAPPQMMPTTMHHMVQSTPAMAPMGDGMGTMMQYGGGVPAMVQQPVNSALVKQELEFTGHHQQYTANGVPHMLSHHRHSSMPVFGLEFSPAPSFVSSHMENYSQRGDSFEPVTPPQLGMTGEPTYIANEETNLYTAIPDHLNANLNGMMQLPPSNLSGPTYPSRSFGSSTVYSAMEGSPTYKQRRRRSSISSALNPTGITSGPVAHAVHRPSDLRRSVSASVGPLAEEDDGTDNSPPGLTYGNSGISHQHHRDIMGQSRQGTPLATIEEPPLEDRAVHQQHQQHQQQHGDLSVAHEPHHHQVMRQSVPTVMRRACSDTLREASHPYHKEKMHTCPIPECRKNFKRLEHLKRYEKANGFSWFGVNMENYNLSITSNITQDMSEPIPRKDPTVATSVTRHSPDPTT